MATIPTPLELLQKELNTLERDLEKSKEMFEAKVILRTTHLLHKCNLLPKIADYQLAVYILTNAKKEIVIADDPFDDGISKKERNKLKKNAEFWLENKINLTNHAERNTTPEA